MKLNSKAKEFIYCLHVTREYGIDDYVAITHAAHESGMFEKVIGEYNFWGIKKPMHSKWLGKIVEIITHEYASKKTNETKELAEIRLKKLFGNNKLEIVSEIQKKNYSLWKCKLPAEFIDWPTCEQALLWYCDLIKRLYPECLISKTAEEFFTNLISNKYKYATDPTYPSKLLNVYNYIIKQENIKTIINTL